jgi:predicted esterase
MEGLPDNVRVVQPITESGMWWDSPGIQALDQYNNKHKSICGTMTFLNYKYEEDALSSNIIRYFLSYFDDGLPSVCKLEIGNSYKHGVENVARLITKMALKTGSIQSVVVGGYSQGAVTAVDAALASQKSAIGSIIMAGATVFDNNLAFL